MDVHGNYQVQDIYLFEQTGRDKDGKVLGSINPTGNVPSFMKEIEVNQLPFPKEMFFKKANNPNSPPPTTPPGKPENQAA
jgi:hypothetical protein